MAARQMMDIGLDADGDLLIMNGDMVIVESTQVHQTNLILSSKGAFAQNPTICVDAQQYLESENPQDLIRAISVEFTRDGMQVDKVTINEVDAYYK